MEDQLVHLLQSTQSTHGPTRQQAESQLQALNSTPGFGVALASIASHESIAVDVRQTALITLRLFIVATWGPAFDEFKGQELDGADKARLRQMLLELSMGVTEDRKIKKSASYTLSRVAYADYPEEWPDLLPTILNVMQTGNDNQLDGALRVLNDLVDDCLSDNQFFVSARDVIQSAYRVAVDKTKRHTVRALAVKVFKGSIASMEQVLTAHKEEVESFASEVLGSWLPLFLETMQTNLSQLLSQEQDSQDSGPSESTRGLIALKVQVVKTLMRIRSVFPAKLAPQSPALFSAAWQELSSVQNAYQQLFIAEQADGRSTDDDDLPYTLDLLVLEELDFLQACLRATAVKKLLESQLPSSQTSEANWVTEVMKLAIFYAQITSEEEGMWNIDVNVFLTEETSVTANYTPRTACGELAVKLAEWLPAKAIAGLLTYTRTLFASDQDWRKKEAALYILGQLPSSDSDALTVAIRDEAPSFVDLIRYAVEQEDVFLRARGYSVAGTLTKASRKTDAQYGVTIGDVALKFMQMTLQSITGDTSELVQASSVRALQFYLQGISKQVLIPLQATIISALSGFIAASDLTESVEMEVRTGLKARGHIFGIPVDDMQDVYTSLLETLRDAILLDSRTCLHGTGLDDLFKIASQAADSFNIISIVTETFENITTNISALGDEPYAKLCQRVLPSLTGAFDVAEVASWSALTGVAAGTSTNLEQELACVILWFYRKGLGLPSVALNIAIAELHLDLLNILIENGPEPLPKGFVNATMPRLNRLLLNWSDEELIKSATSAVKNILMHDYAQLFAWHDDQGKGGLENVLLIIDRLLNPTVEDNAAAQVGGLAAELVEKAGAERLGPFLPQLLSAVAVRLATAEQAQFIQSLILVFARLSLQEQNAKEVIEFLCQVQVGEKSGLEVVISKWLENSVDFAGYDEIRQKYVL